MMLGKQLWTAAAFGLALGAAAIAPAYGHGDEDHGTAKPGVTAANDASSEIDLHDLELTDINGNSTRFVSDVLADRIVAIDFVYTSCTTVCPAISSVFSLVQDELGDRAGRDVWLVSMSIEPVRDSPRRLANYAKKFDSGKGWIWLTGDKPNVDKVLNGLDAYTADIVDHPPMLVIGDAKRGVWRRLFGFPTPEDIIAEIDDLVAARDASHTHVKMGN